MFKRISIELDGPICNCDEQQIAWCPVEVRDEKGIVTAHELHLTCKECKTKLIVPNGKFKASFSFDKPYPGKKEVVKAKQEPTEEEKKLLADKQEEIKKSLIAQANEEEKKKFN